MSFLPFFMENVLSILFNVNIGHCALIITALIGTNVIIDSSSNTVCFTEACVQ